jgi:hypothetical protein
VAVSVRVPEDVAVAVAGDVCVDDAEAVDDGELEAAGVRLSVDVAVAEDVPVGVPVAVTGDAVDVPVAVRLCEEDEDLDGVDEPVLVGVADEVAVRLCVDVEVTVAVDVEVTLCIVVDETDEVREREPDADEQSEDVDVTEELALGGAIWHGLQLAELALMYAPS